MAEHDPVAGRLSFKLVFYGPAQSGKTSNLLWLHDQARPQLKGELMTLETQNDRTLFFDLLPIGFRTETGLQIKTRLFTVPGQVQHDGTRKAVLSRADGVVFVADSQSNQATNNAEAFQNLADNAARVGLDFERLPLVVQFNKRDLPDILSEADIRSRYAGAPWPLTFASAVNGDGVEHTLALLLRQVFARADAEFGLSSQHHVTADRFVGDLLGLSA